MFETNKYISLTLEVSSNPSEEIETQTKTFLAR